MTIKLTMHEPDRWTWTSDNTGSQGVEYPTGQEALAAAISAEASVQLRQVDAFEKSAAEARAKFERLKNLK